MHEDERTDTTAPTGYEPPRAEDLETAYGPAATSPGLNGPTQITNLPTD